MMGRIFVAMIKCEPLSRHDRHLVSRFTEFLKEPLCTVSESKVMDINIIHTLSVEEKGRFYDIVP